MKKTFIFSITLCSFIVFCTNIVSAQEYKYDLNKYYTPDIVRNGLDINLSSTGGFDNAYHPNDTTKSSNLDGQFNFRFTQLRNTRKTESFLQLFIKAEGQISNNKNLELVSKQKNSNSNSAEYIEFSYRKKTYGTGNKFFSLGLSTGLDPASNKSKNESLSSTTENTSNQFLAQISPFAGMGIGRIESVKDARQAVYILEDLSKRGALTRHLSDNEIFQFSQIISHVKNKRFLDARLHRIDEISTVDSFLVKNNLLTKSDAGYFSTLYDNWENSANFERTSGQSFEVRLTPYISWYYEKNESNISNPYSDTWEKQNDKNYGANLAFNYAYAKQINLNWERTANASLSGSTTRQQYRLSTESSQETLNKVNVRDITLSGNYRISYYPSTRTNLSANIAQNFNKNFYDGITNNSWSNIFHSTTSLEFSAVYYVSPQLSLSGNTTIADYYSKYSSKNGYKNDQNELKANFSVALKYSFF